MKGKREVVRKVKLIMKLAQTEAKNNSDRELRPEHILLAILTEESNRSFKVLKNMGVDTHKIYDLVGEHLRHAHTTTSLADIKKLRVPLDSDSNKIMKSVDNEAEAMSDLHIDTTHVILALLKMKELSLTQLLIKNKITHAKFKKGIIDYETLDTKDLTDYELEKLKDMEKRVNEFKKGIENSLPFDDDDNGNPLDGPNKGKSKMTRVKKTTSKTPVLDNFCRDVSKMAAEGILDPVVGREKEVKRVSQILARRKKNNPILIGDPGVGKCFCIDTQVVMRDNTTGEEFTTTIKDLLS